MVDQLLSDCFFAPGTLPASRSTAHNSARSMRRRTSSGMGLIPVPSHVPHVRTPVPLQVVQRTCCPSGFSILPLVHMVHFILPCNLQVGQFASLHRKRNVF